VRRGDPIGRCTGWGFPGGGDWAVDPLRLALSTSNSYDFPNRTNETRLRQTTECNEWPGLRRLQRDGSQQFVGEGSRIENK